MIGSKNERFLLGLTGVAGSGKDSLADVLCEQYDFIKCSFSDALYQEVSEAFNIDKFRLYDRSLKEKPLAELGLLKCRDTAFIDRMDYYGNLLDDKQNSPRRVLQLWGTEYRRNQDPDYWLKKSQAFLDKYPNTNIVNVSTRFPNEARFIKSVGGEIVKIERPGVTAINDHPSDNYYIPADHVVINDGDLQALEGKAHHLMSVLKLFREVGREEKGYDVG